MKIKVILVNGIKKISLLNFVKDRNSIRILCDWDEIFIKYKNK